MGKLKQLSALLVSCICSALNKINRWMLKIRQFVLIQGNHHVSIVNNYCNIYWLLFSLYNLDVSLKDLFIAFPLLYLLCFTVSELWGIQGLSNLQKILRFSESDLTWTPNLSSGTVIYVWDSFPLHSQGVGAALTSKLSHSSSDMWEGKSIPISHPATTTLE